MMSCLKLLQIETFRAFRNYGIDIMTTLDNASEKMYMYWNSPNCNLYADRDGFKVVPYLDQLIMR